MAEENSPRCKVMIQGEGYDAFAIGAAEPDGSWTPFPHQDSYDTQTAVKSCCEYLRSVATQSNPPTTVESLLESMRSGGMTLALLSSRIIAFDGKTFLFHQIPMKVPSESVYDKIMAALPKTKLPVAPIVSTVANAQTASATRNEPTEAPASRVVPQPKVRNIVTVVQGGGGQDQIAEQIMAMSRDPELARSGITKPMMLTSGKKGAVIKDISGMVTEEEIMDRDVDALTGGYAAPAIAEQRMTAPEREEMDISPLDIDLGDEPQQEVAPPSPAPKPKVAAAAPAAVAPRVISGDEGEALGRSSSALSENAQMALHTRHSVEIDTETAELGEDVFLGHSTVSRETGELAAALEESRETRSVAGRNCVINRVSGAGRGGTRPKDIGKHANRN